jgi:hypothetical protein
MGAGRRVRGGKPAATISTTVTSTEPGCRFRFSGFDAPEFDYRAIGSITSTSTQSGECTGTGQARGTLSGAKIDSTRHYSFSWSMHADLPIDQR